MNYHRWLYAVLAVIALAPSLLLAEAAQDEIALTQEAENVLDEWGGQPERLDKAAKQLSLALQKNPNYAKAYMQLGRLHIMAGYYHFRYFEPNSLRRSEQAILKAIELDPQFADAYVLLGHLYTNMDRLPEAKKALATARTMGTSSPWLHLNLADIYERENKYDEAYELYVATLNSGTTNRKALGAAYENLRRYYIRKNDIFKAEEIYKAEIALSPKSAWLRGNYAWALLYQVGDFDKAIEKSREALSIMDYGNARQTLALALYAKWATVLIKDGDKKRAQPYYDEAYRLYPDLKRVRQEAASWSTTQIIVSGLDTLIAQ